MHNSILPDELKHLTGGARWQADELGCSSAGVWRLEAAWGAAWLKTDNSGGELAREAAVLKWVQGKLPAPRVLWHGEEQGREWLLSSEVPGRDLTQISDPDALIPLIAQGMKLLHGLDARECPFSMGLDYKLTGAKKRVEANLVDPEDFEPQFQGHTPQKIWERVLANRPAKEDLVFTHGDYCLPNIFAQDGAISGFIDWGRAGVADRYQDLALAIRSLEHNLGPGHWGERLFEAYGLADPDWQRVEFYILLDELF